MSQGVQHLERTVADGGTRPVASTHSGEHSQGRISRAASGLERDIERSTRKSQVGPLAGKTVVAARHPRIDRNPTSPASEEPKWYSSIFKGFTSQPAKPDIGHRRGSIVEQSRNSNQQDSLDLEGFLEQPAQDSDIRNFVSRLKQSIANHVDNFYGDVRRSLPDQDFLRATRLDEEEIRTFEPLLDEESFRLAAIQRRIAQSAIKKIEFDGNPETTFLPREIVSFLGIVPRHPSEKFQFTATMMFRRTAANLLRLNKPGSCKVFANFQDDQVRIASGRLNSDLAPLANLEYGDSIRENQLEAIIRKFAELGVLLLLQPTTYEFKWSSRARYSSMDSYTDQVKPRARREANFTIFPAFVKTGDNSGQALRRPETICRSEYLEENDFLDEVEDSVPKMQG